MNPISLILRKAAPSDGRQIWNWTNDPGMLRFAFHTSNPVPWEQHCRWFADTLSEGKRTQYVAETPEGVPAGQIRFEPDGDQAVVSVYLAAEFRGKHLAPQLIRMGTLRYCQEKGIGTVIAWIKPENEPSRRSFLAAGYGHAEWLDFAGQPAWRLIWKSSHNDKSVSDVGHPG